MLISFFIWCETEYLGLFKNFKRFQQYKKEDDQKENQKASYDLSVGKRNEWRKTVRYYKRNPRKFVFHIHVRTRIILLLASSVDWPSKLMSNLTFYISYECGSGSALCNFHSHVNNYNHNLALPNVGGNILCLCYLNPCPYPYSGYCVALPFFTFFCFFFNLRQQNFLLS